MPAPLVHRRIVLRDLGRAVLGAVVLGPVVTACAADPGPADGRGPTASAGSTPGPAGSRVWQRASFGSVSAYVLVRGGEALVFDTGDDQDVTPITDALAAAGVGWDDVAHVVVSHRHGDHTGGLPSVVAAAPAALVHAAMPDLEALPATDTAVAEVTDGDEIMGMRVIATPGHTDGHISGYLAELGLLLAGDALTNRVTVGGGSGDGIGGSPPRFTADTEAATASVRLLAGLAPSTILFGHGDPLEPAAEELRVYADSL